MDLLGFFGVLAKETPAPTELESKRWSDFTNPTINLTSSEECLSSDNYLVLRALSEFQSRLAQSLAVMAEQSEI
jgi:hypothetical protein